MGGVADLFFRRRQAKRLAHRAIEPGAGIGGGRPRALIERAEHDHVRLLQAGLERPPDRQARVHGPARAHILAGNEAAVEVRVVGGFDLRARHVGIEQAGEEGQRGVASFAGPQRRGGGRFGFGRGVRRAGHGFGGVEVGLGVDAQWVAAALGVGLDQRRQRDAQAGDEIAGAEPVVFEQAADGGMAEAGHVGFVGCARAGCGGCGRAIADVGLRAFQRLLDAVEAAAEVSGAERGQLQGAAGAAHRERVEAGRVSGCFSSAINSGARSPWRRPR